MAVGEPRAIRLTFAYKGDRITLTEARRLAMFVPPADALDEGPRSGFWAELVDHRGERLFRRVMHHPIGHDREVSP